MVYGLGFRVQGFRTLDSGIGVWRFKVGIKGQECMDTGLKSGAGFRV